MCRSESAKQSLKYFHWLLLKFFFSGRLNVNKCVCVCVDLSENGLFLCNSCRSVLNLPVLCQVSSKKRYSKCLFNDRRWKYGKIHELLNIYFNRNHRWWVFKQIKLVGLLWLMYLLFLFALLPPSLPQDTGPEATWGVQHGGSPAHLGFYLSRVLPDLCQFRLRLQHGC